MQIFKSFLEMKCPGCTWCTFILTAFSLYCYRNIFLQSEICFKLPPIDLVSALNNFDIFVAQPSTERFDLYVNLAKTFDAYKDDYLQHYENYLLMVNDYLILGESQIGLKYYAYKYYINEDYKNQDTFVLGSPIVEFNQNFYNDVENGRNREINLINKHYHTFGISSNKKNAELFFNNYIFPLYKSQGEWKEIEMAQKLSSILNHWILVKTLQIICFICSLVLLPLAFLCFTIESYKPVLLFYKPLAYFIFILYSLDLLSIIILTFVCICVTLTTYQSNMNYEGLHNTSFNVLQFSFILIIVYLSVCWMSKFYNLYNPEKLKEEELADQNDSLQNHIKTLMMMPIQNESSIDIEKNSGKSTIEKNPNLESNIPIENPYEVVKTLKDEIVDSKVSNKIKTESRRVSSFNPIVQSIRRLITPNKPMTESHKSDATAKLLETRNKPTTEIDKDFKSNIVTASTNDMSISEDMIINANLINTGFTYTQHLNPDSEENHQTGRKSTLDSTKLYSKHAFSSDQPIDVVSVVSQHQPNELLYSNASDMSSYLDSSLINDTINGFVHNSSLVSNTKGSISRSLSDKRSGFYQHAGYSVNTPKHGSYNRSSSNKTSSLGSGFGNDQQTTAESKTLKRASTLDKHFHFHVEEDTDIDINNDFDWEKRFGFSSGKSAKTIQVGNSMNCKTNTSANSSRKSSKIRNKTSANTVFSDKFYNSSDKEIKDNNNKSIHETKMQHGNRSKSQREFLLSSTDTSQNSIEIEDVKSSISNKTASHSEKKHMSTNKHSNTLNNIKSMGTSDVESTFSLDRIVAEQTNGYDRKRINGNGHI